MKKIAFILALLTCCAVLFSCGEPEGREIFDADGNAVATGYYDGDVLLYEEVLDSNEDLSKRTTYDDEGRVEMVEDYTLGKKYSESVYSYTEDAGNYSVSETVFNNKGVVVSVTETKYEGDRAVTKTRTSSTTGEAHDVQVSDFVYNEDGTVLEKISSNGTDVREVLTDGNGVLLTDREFNNNGASTKTFYEAGKVVTKIENFNDNGELVVTVVNEYDENGVHTGSKSYNAAGELKDYSEYVYNGSKLVAIYKYYANGSIHSTITYDEEGKATIHTGKYVYVG